MTLTAAHPSPGRVALVATGIDRLDLLDRFNLTGVLTIDGLERVRDWTTRVDPDLPYGALVVEPDRVTLRIRDRGDLRLLLAGANARAQARRALRAKVLETVHALGLPSFREFARPAGAHR